MAEAFRIGPVAVGYRTDASVLRVTDLLRPTYQFDAEGGGMDNELSVPEKLKANAELVVSTFRGELGTELSFDQAGVEWVDGYIERVREHFPKERRSGLVSTLASFVGESIIRTFGGEWVEKGGWWGVQVSERLWACPFAKVEKQFESGAEDSVASFFRCIPLLDNQFEQGRPEADAAEDRSPRRR
jgi:hypothetical protein